MRKIRFIPKISVISFLISQAVFTTSVLAAGFQLNELSPGLQGAATAGAAATNNDVSSMFTNPANLSTLKQNQVYVGTSFISPKVSMSNASAIHTVNIPGSPPSSITATVLGNTSQGNITSWALVPDAYLGWRLADCLVAGIGLTSPFGLSTDYDRHSVLRFAAVESALKTFNINPALALNLNRQWAIGVGLQFEYADATFSNFDGPYTGIPAIDALIAANFRTNLHATGWGYGANFGVLYIPCPATRLGIGYRSKISQFFSGSGRQFTSPGPTVPAPTHNFLFNARTSVEGTLNIPAVLTISAQQDLQNWTLKASAQLNFWSSFKHLSINMPQAFATNTTIQAHWNNVWLFALGADYRVTPEWIVRAGAAYDQTPTVNQFRDPRIPDQNRYWLTAGATYNVNKYISIDGVYEHIFGQNQTVNVTQAAGSSATSTLPLEVNQVRARYKAYVDIVGLALRYSFC